MTKSILARRLAAGASASLIAFTSFWPAAGFAQPPEGPMSSGNPGTTPVAPLVVNAPAYVPLIGSYGGDLRNCVDPVELHSFNQGLAMDDEAGLLIQAELAYRRAYDHLGHAAGEDQKTAQATLNEAERYLADVQEALRLPQGAPVRQIVEAKKAERNSADGVDGIYTPVEFSDLALRNIVASQRTAKGASFIHITGQIYNPRRGSIAIPPLWFAALDSKGDTVKTQQAVATQSVRIKAGSSVPFAFDLPASAEIQRAAVTFAPQNRLPLVGSFDVACGNLADQARVNGYNGRWR